MIDIKGYDLVQAIKRAETKANRAKINHSRAQDALLIVCALIIMAGLFLIGGGYV